MNSTYEDGFALPLPITQQARDMAQQFSREHPLPDKAEQVRLNTLAVSVVNDYLQLMGIPTDLAGSDSWNPVMRLCNDVADLVLPGIGRLECRPLQGDPPLCPVPPEVWEERVGYVVVQIDDAFQEAQLLGYVPQAAIAALPLDRLRPPEDLLDHLYELRLAMSTQTAPTPAPTQSNPRINLSQWLQGVVDSGWETIDWLLNQPELAPAYAFRSSETLPFQAVETGIRRFKPRRLQGLSTDLFVVLMMDVQGASEMVATDTPIDIRLRLHPISQSVLPAGVQLAILDETGSVFLTATSHDQDSYLQLQFSGLLEERFSIQIDFDGVRVTEEFEI